MVDIKPTLKYSINSHFKIPLQCSGIFLCCAFFPDIRREKYFFVYFAYNFFGKNVV